MAAAAGRGRRASSPSPRASRSCFQHRGGGRAAAAPAGRARRRHADRTAVGPWADQVVRDGDRVTGRGQRRRAARPAGAAVRAGDATIAIYPEPVPAPCRVAVTVTGLDLDRLTHRKERDGAVWGSARVEGVYRAGTLTVTRQTRRPARAGAGRGHRRPGALPGAARRLAAPAGRPVAADRRARRGGARRPADVQRPVGAATRTAGTCRTPPTARASRSTWSARPATSRRPGAALAQVVPGRAPVRDRRCAGARPRWTRRSGSCPARRRRRPASPAAGARYSPTASSPTLVVLDERGEPVPRRGGRRPGHAAAVAAQGALTVRPRRRRG